MPELPEVQTIVSDLDESVSGATIVDFKTFWPKAIKTGASDFSKKIKGKKIMSVQRRGKHLLFYLSQNLIMVIHLKMSGHLLLKPKTGKSVDNSHFEDRVNQYVRHSWQLKKGNKIFVLEFSDLRKFGKIRLINKDDISRDDDLSALGVEPLSREFTLKKFNEILNKFPNRPIRQILLDQALIAGIGNIYVSEVLFLSKISHNKKSKDLQDQEKKTIFQAIIKILKKAIEKRGTSDSDYRDLSGASGSYQNFLKVYHKEGERCPNKNCAGKITRQKIGGRSAFFCPSCQK